MIKSEHSFRDLWDNIKQTSILIIIGDLEGEERQKVREKLLEEIMTEKFPYQGKKIDNQVQEVQRSQTR